MKIIITMIFSAAFIAISSGVIADGGLKQAVDTSARKPKPLINVVTLTRPMQVEYIRELHGDMAPVRVLRIVSKHEQRLLEFKAKLKNQKQKRRQGLANVRFTTAY